MCSAVLVITLSIIAFIEHNPSHKVLQHNVEALTQEEWIVVITCLPEEDSICVAIDQGFIVPNAYYSPH